MHVAPEVREQPERDVSLASASLAFYVPNCCQIDEPKNLGKVMRTNKKKNDRPFVTLSLLLNIFRSSVIFSRCSKEKDPVNVLTAASALRRRFKYCKYLFL